MADSDKKPDNKHSSLDKAFEATAMRAPELQDVLTAYEQALFAQKKIDKEYNGQREKLNEPPLPYTVSENPITEAAHNALFQALQRYDNAHPNKNGKARLMEITEIIDKAAAIAERCLVSPLQTPKNNCPPGTRKTTDGQHH